MLTQTIVTKEDPRGGESRQFRVTKSDSGFMIRKTNPDIPEREELYAEAWDLPDSTYTYEETDIKIEIEEPEEAETVNT